ncbi:hypothetical protein pb186bvf_001840 [Paramecium bursaria]
MEEFIFERMQNTCLKHCTNLKIKPQFDELEHICLSRCANKYKETLQFADYEFCIIISMIHELRKEQLSEQLKLQKKAIDEQSEKLRVLKETVGLK